MDNESIIEKLLTEAWTKRRYGKYDESKQLVEKAQTICKEDDYLSLGRIFHIYMQFESDHDHPLKALELCKQSLMYYKKSGNQNKIAHSTRHIADLQCHLGLYLDSEQYYREAIGIYRGIDSTFDGDLANALRGFGIILDKLGKKEESRKVWLETKALYKACNLQQGVDEADEKLSLLL